MPSNHDQPIQPNQPPRQPGGSDVPPDLQPSHRMSTEAELESMQRYLKWARTLSRWNRVVSILSTPDRVDKRLVKAAQAVYAERLIAHTDAYDALRAGYDH